MLLHCHDGRVFVPRCDSLDKPFMIRKTVIQARFHDLYHGISEDITQHLIRGHYQSVVRHFGDRVMKIQIDLCVVIQIGPLKLKVPFIKAPELCYLLFKEQYDQALSELE